MFLFLDERLVVEERELLTLHFINTSHSQLFVYLFCLEETGVCVRGGGGGGGGG